MDDQARDFEVASIIRGMISAENEQIDRRVRAMATFHGLLFTAFGLFWREHDTHFLLVLVSCLGVLVSWLAYTALLGATNAIIKQLRDWEALRSVSYRGPDVIGLFPRPITWKVYCSSEHLFALVFLLTWLIMLVLSLIR